MRGKTFAVALGDRKKVVLWFWNQTSDGDSFLYKYHPGPLVADSSDDCRRVFHLNSRWNRIQLERNHDRHPVVLWLTISPPRRETPRDRFPPAPTRFMAYIWRHLMKDFVFSCNLRCRMPIDLFAWSFPKPIA